MNTHQFLNLIGRKKQTIISLLIVFLAVAVIFSAAMPFKYGSELKLLTVHSFKENTDPYIASKSNEYLSNLLSKIVYSGSFFAKVKDSGFNIDKNYFQGSEKKQMKKWLKTVKAKGLADTGMISISVYHPDRAQAEEIARAVAYTLQTTHSQYHGFGNSVEIKIIDEPLTSNYPVQPNLPLNFALAVAFALVFAASYIYLFPESKYDIRLWPKRKEEIAEAEEDYSGEEKTFASLGTVAPPAFAAVSADEGGEEERYSEPAESALEDYNERYFQNSGSMENVLKR
jgi:capsular polysaccharide biosynthesis protein